MRSILTLFLSFLLIPEIFAAEIQVPEGKTAGERFCVTIRGVEYPFRWCPPGTFLMGSPESEPLRKPDETQHSVTISRGFWLLETEVSQPMWESVMGSNPSNWKGTDLPVEMLCQHDCREFCEKLSRISGLKITLPTESQWEYAARAGTATPYSFGSVFDGTQGNSDGTQPYGTETPGKYLARTAPIYSYAPNPWGFYNMHGNVREWVLDVYGPYPTEPVTDPTGAAEGAHIVDRGGGWLGHTKYCRSAYRVAHDPGYKNSRLGMRIVLEVPESPEPAEAPKSTESPKP